MNIDENGLITLKMRSPSETEAYFQGYAAALNAGAQVCRDWLENYPQDIWPDDSRTSDGVAARMARHLCREIEKDIRTLQLAAPPPPLDAPATKGKE